MDLKELIAASCPLPLRFEPEDAENLAAIVNTDGGVVIIAEGDAPKDEREATAALMVHAVNMLPKLVLQVENLLLVADALKGGSLSVRSVISNAEAVLAEANNPEVPK